MKVALAQTASIKGAIEENIRKHLQFIQIAIQAKADLIVFPELSITSYEPELAKDLACELTDQRLNPFQALANKHDIVIGIGMPIRTFEGIHIALVLFQAFQERICYTKQYLHEDEAPYFVPGTQNPILTIKSYRIAFGICYETLKEEHFIAAIKQGMNLYVASVAKPDRGIQKAALHYPKMAQTYQVPILMANAVGYCDNFWSAGQSGVWNQSGKLVDYLDDQHEGVLIYEVASENVHKVHQL
ncbi:MAG: carbon-nitrogen hydrolase family protein [Bacteroidota bacterium]